jgi:hypothetical protein
MTVVEAECSHGRALMEYNAAHDQTMAVRQDYLA